MQIPSRRRNPPSTADEEDGAGARIAASSLLLLGLIVGLVIGLTYAWIVDPVIYVDASPARLDADYRAEYIFLVSQSYAVDGNWERAELRLQALDDPDLSTTIDALLEDYLRQQRSPDVIRNLAELAQQLGAEGAAIALFAPTPLAGTPSATPLASPTSENPPTATATNTPSPTRPPLATATPPPTTLPSPTPQPVYRLLNQQRLCDSTGPALRIEVVTYDALLNELPGVEILVSWQGGSDSFFTGFKPDLGPGYGDFTMEPDLSYSVLLVDGSPEISGLRIEPCASGFDGGWQLSFQNLRLAIPATATPTP